MITGYIQADLKNPIVHKYLEHSLQSFECVSDVFEIKVIQCITPNEILHDDSNQIILRFEDFDPTKNRSPQEIASLMSQYRLHRRLARGEKFFIMEHDAYLFPHGEAEFRRVLGKFDTLSVCNIGIAMECYTNCSEVSDMFCKSVEADFKHGLRGPMTILHHCADKFSQGNRIRNCWWPKEGMSNKTGLSHNVSTAFRNPMLTIEAPITQLIDSNQGSTVTDRPGVKPKYTPQSHPNFKFISLDF